MIYILILNLLVALLLLLLLYVTILLVLEFIRNQDFRMSDFEFDEDGEFEFDDNGEIEFDENGELIDESKDCCNNRNDESSQVSELITLEFIEKRKEQFKLDWKIIRLVWIGQRKNKKCEFVKWNNEIVLIVCSFINPSFSLSRKPIRFAASVTSCDNEEAAMMLNMEIRRKRIERRRKKEKETLEMEKQKLMKKVKKRKKPNKRRKRTKRKNNNNKKESGMELNDE